MIDDGWSLQRFISELQRRRVLRVAAVYAAAAWVVVEISDTVAPLLLLPDWTSTLVLVLVLLGFPVVIAPAWTFDFTAGGLERTAPPANASAGESGAVGGPAAPPATAASQVSWSASRIPVVGAVAILALTALAMYTTRGTVADGTVDNGVAVLPFENHTGDPELEELGYVAADWITDRLASVPSVEVVPTPTVKATLAQSGPGVDPVAAVSHATRAGLVVTGSFVLRGDSLEVRGQMVERLIRPSKHAHRTPALPQAPLSKAREQLNSQRAVWRVAGGTAYESGQPSGRAEAAESDFSRTHLGVGGGARRRSRASRQS